MWRPGQDRDTNFGMNVFNKILGNAAKGRVTAFTVSELLLENQEGGGVTPHTRRLGLISEICL